MPGDLANHWLAPMLAQFIAQYPAIELHIDLSPRRVDLVVEGYDLAIRVGELADDASLVARRIWAYRPMLYASPDYLARYGMPTSPEDLAQHGRLCTLTREQKPSDWLLQKGEHAWRCQTRAVAAINSPEVLTRLAIAGSGILAAGQMFTDSSVDKGALVRVLPDWHLEKVSIWAVYPGRRLLPSRTRVFLDMLEAWLRPGA